MRIVDQEVIRKLLSQHHSTALRLPGTGRGGHLAAVVFSMPRGTPPTPFQGEVCFVQNGQVHRAYHELWASDRELADPHYIHCAEIQQVLATEVQRMADTQGEISSEEFLFGARYFEEDTSQGTPLSRTLSRTDQPSLERHYTPPTFVITSEDDSNETDT